VIQACSRQPLGNGAPAIHEIAAPSEKREYLSGESRRTRNFGIKTWGVKMFKLVLGSVLTVFVLAGLVCQPAFADGMTSRKHPRTYLLGSGRHVVEVVRPPYSGNFIINGERFVGRTPACLRWVAGDRIRLVAGDWHARCVDAVFYNYTRRSTCQASCGGWW
jgi:hypothetical protein